MNVTQDTLNLRAGEIIKDERSSPSADKFTSYIVGVCSRLFFPPKVSGFVPSTVDRPRVMERQHQRDPITNGPYNSAEQ